jgi:hypothetical protein
MTTDTLFNNPVESALRSLILLVEAFPQSIELQKLVYLDYLLVHSADAGGPASLHPATPQREGEVVVRRGLIEQGLNLLLVRGLIERQAATDGFRYAANDSAGGLVVSLAAPYNQELRKRAEWVTATFAQQDTQALASFFREQLGHWGGEFALTAPGWEDLA